LKEASINQLGPAPHYGVTEDDTTIVEGSGDPQAISSRDSEIRTQIDEPTSAYDRAKLQERLAKLAGCVTVIKVGAATETELKERKHRMEDALNSTRAAVEEGIVSGGGTALINVYDKIANLSLEGDEATGANIVLRAL